MDASVGVPPDAFSDTGQDWGLPLYRWDVLAARDFDWLRDRARRYADLYDGYRIDHLVGFYRTYFRPHDGGPPQFVPASQVEQVALGERVLAVFRDAGAAVTAEDLGVIPGFVHASLARLEVPGYKVFRWEREWDVEGQPFRDPVTFPACAVATSGTHDTEPLVTWWENAPVEEREAVLEIPSVQMRLFDTDGAHATEEAGALPPETLSAAIHDALIDTLNASGADLLILPMQDVFGWSDRINLPATVSADNWTWKMPWPVERLAIEPEAVAVAARLREWARRHGR